MGKMGDLTGDEPQAYRVSDVPNEMANRFARGDRMRDLYAQMRPDQRTAIAGEFIRLLALAGDNRAEQFRELFQRHTQITTDAQEELLSEEEVASIDSYVRQQHPEIIEQVMRHPVTQASLRTPGAEPEPAAEEEAPQKADLIMPTENVVTTGTGYMSGGVMMDEGGNEYNRMVEDPHEWGVGSDGEIEREHAQRALENEGEEGGIASLDPPEEDS